MIHKAFSEFRITHYNNKQLNFYMEKVGSVFVVNVRLIKIKKEVLFIILRLNEHILTTLCVAVLSGTVNLAPKKLQKFVGKN